MAPYDYNWNGYGSQQQNATNYPGHNQNTQYSQTPTSTYQSPSYQPTADNNYRGWYQQPASTATSSESRAAETLSSLSHQEPAYGQTQSVNSTSAYGSSSSYAPRPATSTSTASRQGGYAAYDNTAVNPNRSAYDTSGQSGSYNQQNAYGQSSASASQTGYQANRTSTSYNPVVDYARQRTAAVQANAATQQQQQTMSPRQTFSNAGRASPAQSQASFQASNVGSLPANHARTSSMTPTSVQQQARHAPLPAPASAGPSTIDPTQVYDPWPEKQRQAERAAEERRKIEAEQAKQKAAEEQKRKEEEAEAAKKAAEERERQEGIERAKQLSAAAMAAPTSQAVPANGMEDEMRAMFQKMRQFNQMNPKMLARLWEEERQTHVSKSASNPEATASTTGTTSAAPTAAVPAAASPSTSTKKATSKAAKGNKASKKQAQAAQPTAASTSKVSTPAKATPAQAAPQAAPPAADPPPVQTIQQAAATPTTPAQAAQSTTWPPGRKQLLAETAVRYFKRQKQNAGKDVTVAAFTELLNGNPSYPVLCETIERMGLYLDRSIFARTLLMAVPDLNKSAVPVGPPSVPLPLLKDQTAAGFAAAMASVAEEQRGMDKVPLPPGDPWGFKSKAAATAAAAPVKEEPRPFSRILPNGMMMSKEEAARKRTLQDFMDLTKDDSDPEEVPPPKMQNVGQYNYALDGSTLSPPPSSVNGNHTAPPAASVLDLKSQRPMVHSREAELKGKHIVQAIRRDKVARKSTYDPRTIARDILLATGRHPEMRALNGHLMGMQQLLASYSDNVEYHKYDLATLRWDLIDPGDVLPESEDDQSDAGDEADDESDDPFPDTIARTMTQRGVSNGDGTMSVAMTTEMPTLKHGFKAKKRRGRPPRQSVPGTTQFGANGNPGTSLGAGHVKTRGAGADSAPKNPPQRATSGGTPTGSTPSGAIGYAAFRNQTTTYDENGNPVKKKLGRPVGWRKAIHSKEAQALAQGASPSLPSRSKSNVPSEMKRRPGRPKLTGDEPPPPPPEPHYNVYKCCWEGCTAQLHNLETLRKHIIKLHANPDQHKMYTCLWGGCTGHNQTDTKGKQPASDRQQFASIHTWMNHVDKSHVQRMARSLGDGPRGGLSDAYDSEASQAYLSDASGRIVTPRATPLANVAEEQEQQAASLAPVLRQGMPRVRGILSQGQKEDEYKLQQLEARKLAIGAGFDKGGARIATEERREGLYDDEEFEGSCSEDDGPE